MRDRTLSSLCAALVSFACLSPAAARADDVASLRTSAHAWLDGERESGYLWGSFGLASLGTAGALHRFGGGSDVERGMAYPIAAIGVLQLGIGVGSLLQPRSRGDAVDAQIARNPAEARQREIARMQTMGTAFLAVQIVETLVVVGAASYAATRTGDDQQVSRGVGLGLAAQGGAMLLLDALAAARAERYRGRLDGLSLSVGPGSSGRGLSLVGRF